MQLGNHSRNKRQQRSLLLMDRDVQFGSLCHTSPISKYFLKVTRNIVEQPNSFQDDLSSR